MSNKLSHSSVSKFQHCPTAWKYHYVERIRPTRQHAALSFGTALDKAIGALLENSNPHEVFEKFWRFQYLNNKQTYLPDCIDVVYAESDFDKDLISDDSAKAFELTKKEIIEAVSYKEEKGFDNIPDEIKKIANIGYWLCLLTKGKLMIDAFIKKVQPKLTKIYSTQEYVELENEEQDKIIGYVDLVADVVGYDTPIILDVKTSAREYKDNSAIYSPQLTLYINALGDKYGTRKAGFIVLSKQIIKNKTKICSVCNHDGSGGSHKTCNNETMQTVESKKGPVQKAVRCGAEWVETLSPEAYVQFIIDEIPQQTEELVMDNISDINNAIKSGVFTKNLSNCLNSFGKPCEYLNLCYKGSMENLVKSEESK